MAWARFGQRWARDVLDVRTDLDDLGTGFWGVVVSFEGSVRAVRFGEVDERPRPAARWTPTTGEWLTSLDRNGFVSAVEEVRERIAAGTVYQVNVCRVLSHPLAEEADLAGLDALLAQGNPAPYSCAILVPEAGLEVVCASPEAYLVRDRGWVTSRPIKGTSTSIEAMLPKDYSENVMIVDLVRNDLSHVCRPGTVEVTHLCSVEAHPGLVHLVSDVTGHLCAGVTWADVLEASFPPGSVSGAPKSTALQAIADLEPSPRGPYCGAVGWVDVDRREAELAVGIRTFWAEHDEQGQRWLRFGAGSGITWDSDALGEWEESELKARRLIGLASGRIAVR